MIYLDNHATTRTDPRVVAAMLPYFTEHYGNAASVSHRFGWEAGRGGRAARASRSPGPSEPSPARSSSRPARPNRTTWRSKGSCTPRPRRGNHLVTAATEHKAVLDPVKRLAREGWAVTVVPCDEYGSVSAEAVGGRTHRSDGPGLGHGRQQRGRHAQSDRRDRQAVPRARHRLSHRCRPGRRQGADRRPGRLRSICSASRPTRSMAPRGSAPFTFAVATRRCGSQPLLDGGGHERGLRSGTVAGPAGRRAWAPPSSLRCASVTRRLRRMLDLRERLA